MKKLLIATAVLGIAAAIGVVWHAENSKKSDEKSDEKNNDPIRTEPNDVKTSYSILNDQKASAASTVSERHSMAAQIIKDAITKSNVDARDNENEMDFDEISSSLNNLLEGE